MTTASSRSNMKPRQDPNRPTRWRRLRERWKRIGKAIADIQARALLILFYFVVLAPFALAIRWGSDPLAIKAGAPTGWRPREDEKGTPMERAARQF